MARSTMEVAFLGTQKVAFSNNGGEVKIVKVFYGDEPNGITENGLSIVSMDVPPEVADEVFATGANIAPLETVRISFEIARAGKQKGNNLCLHIEPVKARDPAREPAQRQTPAQPNPAAKPAADAAKS